MAALRYALYWECRKEVFGEKYLMRMTLSEALKDDSVALGIGMYTILPHRDVSGRLVLYMEPGRHSRDGYTSESLVCSLNNMHHCRLVCYIVSLAKLLRLQLPASCSLVCRRSCCLGKQQRH